MTDELINITTDPPVSNLDDKGRIKYALSYSAIQSFLSCPLKFILTKWNIDVEREYHGSAATLIGEAFHQGIQSYMHFKTKLNEFEARERATVVFLMRYPIKLKKAQGGNYGLYPMIQILQKTFDFLYATGYELVYINNIPAIEWNIETLVEYDNLKHTIPKLGGLIDLILRDPSTGELIVVDIKSTTWVKSVEDIAPMYATSLQTIEYARSLVTLLGINPDETILRVGYLVIALQGVNSAVYYRTFYKTKKDLDYYANVVKQIASYVDFYYDKPHLALRNSANCKQFGGQCEFFDLCAEHCHMTMDFTKPDKYSERYNALTTTTLNLNEKE